MVIKRIIPIFLILSFFVNQSVVAGPGNRLFPWLVTSIITSVGSVGYMIGNSAKEAAPLITQQAIEQIATRAATQATEQVGQQGPGLVAQAASSGWQALKAIAPSLLSKQGAVIATGLATSALLWRNRAAIKKNLQEIRLNNGLIKNVEGKVTALHTYAQKQFGLAQAERAQSEQANQRRHDEAQAERTQISTDIAQLQQGQRQILTALGAPEGQSIWQGISRFFGNTNPSEQE